MGRKKNDVDARSCHQSTEARRKRIKRGTDFDCDDDGGGEEEPATGSSRGVMTVEIRQWDKIEDLLERLSKTEGVMEANYNHLTSFLEITHHADPTTMREISEQLRPFRSEGA